VGNECPIKGKELRVKGKGGTPQKGGHKTKRPVTAGYHNSTRKNDSYESQEGKTRGGKEKDKEKKNNTTTHRRGKTRNKGGFHRTRQQKNQTGKTNQKCSKLIKRTSNWGDRWFRNVFSEAAGRGAKPHPKKKSFTKLQS